MTPFHVRVPEPGLREIRCVHVSAAGDLLPMGEYVFLELFCEDLDCDCRRVLLQVISREAPKAVLATINFGWETAAFYTAWMHGDTEAGHEITEAALDPLNRQSKYADHLLDLFRSKFMTDTAYVARLARHYEMFKQALRTRPIGSSRPGRNDSCPCGSGRKYKKCCGAN